MAGSDPTYGVNMAKKIEHWSTDRLIPYENNSRTHSSEQVGQIAQSIVEFGFLNPILVDTNDGIIAGHGRLEAAKELKLEEVPVVVLDHLSEKQRKAYIIVDNKLALNAGWDENALATEVAELNELDFDIELLGFTEEELEGFMPEELETEEYGDAESIPDIPEEAETKEGDLYILGNHRLLCGDSTSIENVERLMDGKKAQAFFSDPPYGDNAAGSEFTKESGKGGRMKRVSFMANDKNIDWLEDVFNLVPPFLEEKNTKMVFFKWDKFEQIKTMAKTWGNPTALCVWNRVRGCSAFLRFMPNHELCFHWGDMTDKKERGNLTNVWNVQKEYELKELHPTVKPIEIIEPALRVITEKKKIVLDLFGGSGSTLISAEKSNRSAYLMELDPKYCDVIVKRWEDFTGKKAKLQSTN